MRRRGPAHGGYSFLVGANDRLMAGSEGAVWVSDDHGDTWTEHRDGLGSGDVRVLIQGARGDLLAGAEDGLYRSVDNGALWSRTGLAEDVRVVVATAGGGMLTTGPSGMFRSADYGAHWSLLPAELRDAVRVLVVDPAGYVYAGTEGGGVVWSRSRSVQSAWTPGVNRVRVGSPTRTRFSPPREALDQGVLQA